MTKTEVLTVAPGSPSGSVIEAIARQLEAGHLVVVPTETQYGLLVRADDPAALESLLAAKHREAAKPTALLVSTPADLNKFGRMNRVAQQLAEAFLPGPLTLVLQTHLTWPLPLVVSQKIGLRCSSSVLIGEVLQRLNFPVTATSANRSGDQTAGDIEQIVRDLGPAVHLYVDGGPLTGPPSTVVDCSDGRACILREGAVSQSDINRAAHNQND